MTVFLIVEPKEAPRTVQLRTRGQELQTSRGHEKSLLDLAKLKNKNGELFESSGSSQFPLLAGTEILSCEVRS